MRLNNDDDDDKDDDKNDDEDEDKDDDFVPSICFGADDALIASSISTFFCVSLAIWSHSLSRYAPTTLALQSRSHGDASYETSFQHAGPAIHESLLLLLRFVCSVSAL
jgi:hypothetical protein